MGWSTGKLGAAPKPARRHGSADSLIGAQRRNFARLRAIAMRLADALDRKAKGEAAAPSKEQEQEKQKEQIEIQLLAKNDGIIDGFNTITQIVSRIAEQERQSFGLVEAQSRTQREPEPYDEQALERRIIAELDRVAARGEAPGVAGSDRAGG